MFCKPWFAITLSRAKSWLSFTCRKEHERERGRFSGLWTGERGTKCWTFYSISFKKKLGWIACWCLVGLTLSEHTRNGNDKKEHLFLHANVRTLSAILGMPCMAKEGLGQNLRFHQAIKLFVFCVSSGSLSIFPESTAYSYSHRIKRTGVLSCELFRKSGDRLSHGLHL